MNIVLVSICYPPEIRSISTMVREFAEELVNRGHAITVLTGWPQYNLSEEDQRRTFKKEMIENGVRVIRIKTLPTHKVPYVFRGIGQILLPPLFWRAYRHCEARSAAAISSVSNQFEIAASPSGTRNDDSRKFDAVVVYSPHLPLTKVANKIKKKFGARYLLNIQDIFPQNAIDLGILKSKWLIRYFENMERRAYEAADAITTCTQNARQFLIDRKGLPPEKVTWVPNWIDVDQYERIQTRGEFRKKYDLTQKRHCEAEGRSHAEPDPAPPGNLGRDCRVVRLRRTPRNDDAKPFIILFPGILGPSQGMDFVIDVAKAVSDISDIMFLFVGDGTEKARAQNRAQEHGLQNVQFEPFVSPDAFPVLLKDVDVGLLALKHDSGTPTVPGKFYGFAAARLPVLGFLNKESEGHRMVKEAKCGYTCISDDINVAAELVRKMYYERDRLSELGDRGFAYVKEHFSKEKCINMLEHLIGCHPERSEGSPANAGNSALLDNLGSSNSRGLDSGSRPE